MQCATLLKMAKMVSFLFRKAIKGEGSPRTSGWIKGKGELESRGVLTPVTPPAAGADADAACARTDLQDAARRPGRARPGRATGEGQHPRRARVASAESSSVASIGLGGIGTIMDGLGWILYRASGCGRKRRGS